MFHQGQRQHKRRGAHVHLLSAALVLAAPTVRAQSTASARALTSAQDEATPLPVSFWLTYSQFVGQGTVVVGPTFNPYVLSDLNAWLQFRYEGFRLQLSQEAFVELTQSDTTTTALQPQLADPIAQLSYDVAMPWGFALTANLNGTLPLSLASRASGSVGSLGTSAQGQWTLGDVGPTLWASAGATYNALVPQLADRFSLAPARPFRNRAGLVVTPRSCIRRSAAELGQYACTALPSAGWGSLAVGGSWAFFDGLVTIGAWASLVSSLSAFVGPDDSYTADNAVSGLFFNHTTTGVTSLTLAPTDWLALTAGTWSFQPLLTADGKMFRFVFWDVVAMRDNWSTVYAQVAVGF